VKTFKSKVIKLFFLAYSNTKITAEFEEPMTRVLPLHNPIIWANSKLTLETGHNTLLKGVQVKKHCNTFQKSD